MRVRLGWSGEIDSQWHKVDVELEEEDLARMCREADVPVTTLTEQAAFRLQKNMAEQLMLSKLVDHGYPYATASVRMETLEKQNDKLFTALRARNAKASA